MTSNDPALMNDPGALFANVPGILGFYPEESIVVLCLDLVEETTSRYQLGEVIRVDIEDIAHLIIAPEILSDLLLALVVSENSPAAEQLTEIAEILTGLRNLKIKATWHTPSITEGERSSPLEWCICPFDKTGSVTVSGTGTSPILGLAHATS